MVKVLIGCFSFPAIGTCANVTALERTKHGPFTLQDCLHAENYTRENVISAVNAAREKHPKLTEKLERYWSEHTTDTVKKKAVITTEERTEDSFVEDYSLFVRAKNKEESENKDIR